MAQLINNISAFQTESLCLNTRFPKLSNQIKYKRRNLNQKNRDKFKNTGLLDPNTIISLMAIIALASFITK